MLKIELDENNTRLVTAIAEALFKYTGEAPQTVAPVEEPEEVKIEEAVEPAPTPATSGETSGPVDGVDGHGVPFNEEFCGQAAEPFYKDGNKRAGQWKKRQGVDFGDYDRWYASERAAQLPTNQQPVVDTSQAFPRPVADEGSGEPINAPENGGQLMAWISAKQTAGLLTQSQIEMAYAETGVVVQDLFSPDKSAEAAAALYGVLVKTAGA